MNTGKNNSTLISVGILILCAALFYYIFFERKDENNALNHENNVELSRVLDSEKIRDALILGVWDCELKSNDGTSLGYVIALKNDTLYFSYYDVNGKHFNADEQYYTDLSALSVDITFDREKGYFIDNHVDAKYVVNDNRDLLIYQNGSLQETSKNIYVNSLVAKKRAIK